MAETEFVLSRERLHRFIEQEFAECIISKDDGLPFGRGPDRDLLERLDLRLQQLFIKHPSFATDTFKFKPHEYPDGSRLFRVDQFAGSGHLKMLTLPLPEPANAAFRVTVSHQSFFVENDAHISPPAELKKFYLSTVASAKKGTKRVEVWLGRGMWFEQQLQKSNPGVLEALTASFRHT